VRTFLAAHVTRELHQKIHETGTNHDPAFTKALVERGWVAPSIPSELGGGGLPPMSVVALAQELRRVDAPTYGTGTTTMVAAVIGEIGTPEQRDEIIPKALAGEIIVVLGFTEPECGSDLASVTTKAVRDGDDWVIDGQKMFTTNAHIGDYAFLLARTNPDVPKHKGLTMFLVPLDQPGVEIQAVRTLSGERTNITYLNGVRVSDRWRIGEVDGGWATMGVSLRLEHGTGFAPAVERLLLATEAWATDAGRLDDADVRLVMGRTAACFEAARALQARVPWMVQAGIPTTVEGPMSKLFSSESLERRAEEVIEVMGPDGLRSYFDPTAPVDGLLENLLFFSLGTTIYAGTSEVHRNMIAQRGLGLPRST
jgi:alkylation response protein AidB-like acyl-CoA dehydrogenase